MNKLMSLKLFLSFSLLFFIKLKADFAHKNNLKRMPKLIDIISAIPENYKKKLLPILKAKPVRTASGIAVVAVMCKPHRCNYSMFYLIIGPHIATTGNICIYCPGVKIIINFLIK